MRGGISTRAKRGVTLKDNRKEIEHELDRYCFIARVEREMLILALCRLIDRRVKEALAEKRQGAERDDPQGPMGAP